MRKTLLATTALAAAGMLAAGPALAADMLSVGVGGYMQQWIGYADRTDKSDDGGMDIDSDSEIHFKGSLDADMGLKFTVHVELEANNEDDKGASGGGDNTEIDESFLRVSGGFGQLEMGQRDSIMVRMHTGIKDVGIGLHAGDTQKWIPGEYLETAGHAHAQGDDVRINYATPRVNGIQVGLSYTPDADNENRATSVPVEGNQAAWAAAVNFNTSVDETSVSVSLGHYQREQASPNDDYTYTNAGVGVGFGAFALNVSYAERDGGDKASKADDWSTVGASVTYTDGPMALSLGHMTHETDAETERNATMLSAAYTLAPGVAWKSSLFAVEDTTRAPKKTMDSEGTAFVTGFALSF